MLGAAKRVLSFGPNDVDPGLYLRGGKPFRDTANEYLHRGGEVDFFVEESDESPSGAVNRIMFWNKVVPPPTGGHD